MNLLSPDACGTAQWHQQIQTCAECHGPMTLCACLDLLVSLCCTTCVWWEQIHVYKYGEHHVPACTKAALTRRRTPKHAHVGYIYTGCPKKTGTRKIDYAFAEIIIHNRPTQTVSFARESNSIKIKFWRVSFRCISVQTACACCASLLYFSVHHQSGFISDDNIRRKVNMLALANPPFTKANSPWNSVSRNACLMCIRWGCQRKLSLDILLKLEWEIPRPLRRAIL